MNKHILSIVTLLITVQLSFSQEDDNIGTEVINVVKPYTPTVSDAFKIKEIPVIIDSTDLKKRTVEYSISSIPVASTFTPSKGKAAGVEKQAPEKTYNNYASLGLGNYLNFIGELYATLPISNSEHLSVGLDHHSTQGEINDIQLDDKFYDTSINLSYAKKGKEIDYQVNGIFKHQLYNWFGTSYILTDAERANIDASHTYLTGGISGNLEIHDSFFKGASLDFLRFWDDHNTSENHLSLNPEFEFDIMDKKIDLEINADYLDGLFDINNLNVDYSHFLFEVHPNYKHEIGEFVVNIGINTVLEIDGTNEKTNFLVFPKIKINYPLVDDHLIIMAKIDGGVIDNSYQSFSEKNKYIAPLLYIQNTHALYDLGIGFKGKVGKSINYFIDASYKKESNKAFFLMNPINNVATVTEDYLKANTFGVIYDDVITTNLYAKISSEIVKNYTIGASVNYDSYKMTDLKEAWNLPNLTATMFGKFKFSEKLFGGVDVFYVGERKDLLQSNTVLLPAAEATLDDYLDLNLNLGYNLTNRFTVFLKGHNLASENYQKYLSYPVQQIQILGGLTYKFDFK